MQFDWTTFILEILNFLVLLWILQRLVYRPILALLDSREKNLQAQLDNTEHLRQETEALKAQYQGRLAAWQQERETALHALEEELSLMRMQTLEELKQLRTHEEAKRHARDEALAAAQSVILLREATRQAYAQSAAMLERLASPHLTHAIVEIFSQDLHSLDQEQHDALCQAARKLKAKEVEIVSAHPLTASHIAALTASLQTVTESQLQVRFHEDERLIAGLRATIGEYQLHANLADELVFFQTQPHHA